MSKLAPNLFTRRFSDFLEIGRARLHALAPLWTDYNAHDPGITLMELLAWTSEAQLYSLSRVRRDERMAYAALLGVQPSGTQPATGLIWPDSLDPESPAATYTASLVLAKHSAVTLADIQGPLYRTLQDFLWVPGAIQSLVTRQGNTRIDHTSKNKGGKLVFYPFGQGSAIGTTLRLSFHCRDDRGLFGAGDRSARWPIGVLASPSATETGAGTGADISAQPGSRLSAALLAGGERFPLTIVADTSQSMLTTGVILLDLGNVRTSPVDFVIEFTAPQDLVRPPRVLRIEANVLPIEQLQAVVDDPHISSGLPGWSFTLEKKGVQFASGGAPVAIQTLRPATVDWRQCARLSELGAEDRAFEFDRATGTVTFGNGINGRVPDANSQVLASYQISDGAAGNTARNRRWIVKGFQGVYGLNPNPLSGGLDATNLAGMKRASRSRIHDEHPLITAKDIEEAACKLALLEVGRAWTLDPSPKTPRTGTITLIAMRQRPGGIEPALPPETPLWLKSIHQLLRQRMPLGSRLRVRGPQYVPFTINARIETVRGLDPLQVQDAVKEKLVDHFRLVPPSRMVRAVQPGVPVSTRDIAGLIRAVDGVKDIKLSLAPANSTGSLSVPANGLVKLDIDNSPINVVRSGPNGGSA